MSLVLCGVNWFQEILFGYKYVNMAGCTTVCMVVLDDLVTIRVFAVCIV